MTYFVLLVFTTVSAV